MVAKDPAKYSIKWENITDYCKRLKVPGGWIVCVWNDRNVNSICFLPDIDYGWILDK